MNQKYDYYKEIRRMHSAGGHYCINPPVHVMLSIFKNSETTREALAQGVIEKLDDLLPLTIVLRELHRRQALIIWRYLAPSLRIGVLAKLSECGMISEQWDVHDLKEQEMILTDAETAQWCFENAVRTKDYSMMCMLLDHAPIGMIDTTNAKEPLTDPTISSNMRLLLAIARKQREKRIAKIAHDVSVALCASLLVACVRDLRDVAPLGQRSASQNFAIMEVAREPNLMRHIARLMIGKEPVDF